MQASFLPHSSSSGRQFFSFMPGVEVEVGWEGEVSSGFKLFFFIRRVSLPVLSLEDPYSIPILANIEKSPPYGTNCYFKRKQLTLEHVRVGAPTLHTVKNLYMWFHRACGSPVSMDLYLWVQPTL